MLLLQDNFCKEYLGIRGDGSILQLLEPNA